MTNQWRGFVSPFIYIVQLLWSALQQLRHMWWGYEQIHLYEEMQHDIYFVLRRLSVTCFANQWTALVWLSIDQWLTNTNRYQLTNFMDWYWFIDCFSDHQFLSIGHPRLYVFISLLNVGLEICFDEYIYHDFLQARFIKAIAIWPPTAHLSDFEISHPSTPWITVHSVQ